MSQAQYFDAQGNPIDTAESRMAQVPRKVIRKLEKEAEEGRKALAENEQLKRERAFVQAGIPLEDKRAAYFIAGYSGDQTAEAIRQEWNESFGAVSGGGASGVIDQELDALQRAQQLIGGAGAPAPDQLALRNAELAALSQTDPLYPQKFDAVMAKYGTPSGVGSMTNRL